MNINERDAYRAWLKKETRSGEVPRDQQQGKVGTTSSAKHL